ncbi:MAG TPA: BrnT family toxin [Candidatus Sulfotelmatobacter sp.]|nr:BrnT family toxin [Candidatus Sulfotelmatobacter sp.]
MIRFEWDPLKARANERKHGVSFEIARYAFDDPDALMNHERIERGERRWQTLGMVGGTLLLLIAHTVEFEEQEGEIIRIISARRAERKERRRYEKARQENRER